MNMHTLTFGLIGLGLLGGAAAGVAVGQPIASEVVGRVVESSAARGFKTPTIKEIMRDPDWIARSPSGAWWADDGSAVFYRRERLGDEGISDTWAVRLDENGMPTEPTVVPDDELDTLPSRSGDWQQLNGQWHKTFTRGGDVWLQNLDAGWERRLTATGGRRGSAFFVRGGAAVAWSGSGTVTVRDLMSGLVEIPVRVELRDAPKPLEEKWADEDKKQDDLEDQQERLFAIIRDRERRARAREAVQQGRSEADEFEIPTVYLGDKHLGKTVQNVGMSLNEDTRWLAYSVREQVVDAERDVMPIYVTDDGNVDTQRLRPKVGLRERAGMWVALIDIENETAHWLDWSELPMVRDDPLAWLKESNEAEAEETAETVDDAAAEADGAKAEDAKSSEAETDAEAAAENASQADEPGPIRDVSVMGWSWNEAGTQMAVLVRSQDNKDRWLVVVDVTTQDEDGDPTMRVVEYQREEGWINWSFNQMGWLPDGRLWFTSEKSGYSRLFVWDGASGGEPELVSGAGAFLVERVTPTVDGAWLYFRTNRNHPTEYELERWNALDGRHEVVTALGGSVDSFTLNPRETQEDGHRLVLQVSSTMRPGELLLIDVPSALDEPFGLDDLTLLTQTIEDGYLGFDWIEPEFVEVPSSHSDLPVHARVYLDPDAPVSASGRPIVIFSHGAGYLQHVYKGWSGYFREHMFHTLLARAGVVVIAPDFRASKGYGKAWRQAIYRRMGEPELQDFDDCIDWVVENHQGDRERVGVYGGSYGGFMAIMAMFERPGVYRAGAALRPVTDWMHYNDGYTANILNTPQVDPEAYLKSSPIEYAERFREGGVDGRLLLLHGMVDDNVVVQDSIRLAQRLIELEKEGWEMALYPIEPHGFRESTGWLDEYRRIFSLFAQEVMEPAWLDGWPRED